MTTTFTIQIAPIKALYTTQTGCSSTVCKKYVGGKVIITSFVGIIPNLVVTLCSRIIPFIAEEQYKENFAHRVQRAFDKAWVRFSHHYKDINFEDEIVRVYAPYRLAPNATITVYSQRVHQYNAHRDFLRDIVSKMNNHLTHSYVS